MLNCLKPGDVNQGCVQTQDLSSSWCPPMLKKLQGNFAELSELSVGCTIL